MSWHTLALMLIFGWYIWNVANFKIISSICSHCMQQIRQMHQFDNCQMAKLIFKSFPSLNSTKFQCVWILFEWSFYLETGILRLNSTGTKWSKSWYKCQFCSQQSHLNQFGLISAAQFFRQKMAVSLFDTKYSQHWMN